MKYDKISKKVYLTDPEAQCNYYKLEQQAINYAAKFFQDICSCQCGTVNDRVLPITFYCEQEEIISAMDRNEDYFITGGHVIANKKQSYIRIGLSSEYDVLLDDTERIIRHEIIHYYLWLCDLPHADDSLEFWCMCYAYDADAYKKLNEQDKKKFNAFKRQCNKYKPDTPYNVWHIVLGAIVSEIHEIEAPDVKVKFKEYMNNVKKVFIRD